MISNRSTMHRWVVNVKYTVLRRIWLIVFLFGLIGNGWFVLQMTQTLVENSSTNIPDRRLVDLPTGSWHAQQKPAVMPKMVSTTDSSKRKSSAPKVETPKKENDQDFFSICLLIKDDNDLLNEWIAYHYHVLKLRHLVVAVDPESETSPAAILETWRKNFGLQVDEWTDQNYMPEFFLQGMYEHVPRMIKWSDNATKWKSDGVNVTSEDLEKTFQKINRHRYRQSKFLKECILHLQKQDRKWVTHVDTDEFIVINPALRQEGEAGNITVPTILGQNTIFSFLQDLVHLNSGVVNWPCISMPRLLFGAREDPVSSGGIGDHAPSRLSLETMRWKYHADYADQNLNRLPKVIMDVSGVPPSALNSSKVFSIHRPSLGLCRRQAQMDMTVGRKYPITVNHYIGSLSRYMSRKDARRTPKTYWQKADIQAGKDDDWMDGWLDSFVDTYGLHKASSVLRDYMDAASVNDRPMQLGLSAPLEEDSFAACMIFSDDTSILSEWIAYHYHALKLRTLIVAVDPSSETSPSAIFEKWRGLMHIEEWNDEHFMPESFLQGHQEPVLSIVDDRTDKGESVKMNKRQYRQSTFLGSCIHELRRRGNTWMMHIDVDEYVVLNPVVRQKEKWRGIQLDRTRAPSFILDFLKQAAAMFPKPLKYPCISMPSLFYGAFEEESPRNSSLAVSKRFETLRWKYHSELGKDNEGKPKVIMDLSGIPPKANFLNQDQVFSIHRPSAHMCRGSEAVTFDKPYKFPVAINYYLGSWERYSMRNDPRPSRQVYDAKVNVATGKGDNWIDGWVDSFVKVHGIDTATELLDCKREEISSVTSIPLENKTISVDEVKPIPSYVQGFNASTRDSFSACMLIKDDNDILNEWIAYHFHTIGLRYMIVALDANSTTSPSAILDKWRNFGMTIEEWNDRMFMPDVFFQHAYHLMPRLAKFKKNKHKWIGEMDNEEKVTEYLHAINDHRFRQITFLSECTKALRKQKRTWMIHIDTDEYIMLNPMLRKQKRPFGKQVKVPKLAGPSSILNLLNQMVQPYWDYVNYPCISMPRLLFGSIEDSGESNLAMPSGFNGSKFESLRWKYHAAYDDVDLNKQPKVIMDVSVIPEDDKMLTDGRVFSIHRPSHSLCRNQGQMNFELVEDYPLTVNHYLGTYERFSARIDPRRNRKLYDAKANIKEGKDDYWINSWLPSFIEEHGADRVFELLGDYTTK